MEFPDVKTPQETLVENPKGNPRDELALLRRLVVLLTAMNDGEITIHPDEWGAMAHIDAEVTIDTAPDGSVRLHLTGKAPDGISKLDIDEDPDYIRTMMKLWLKANKAYRTLCDLMMILGEKEYFIPRPPGVPPYLKIQETEEGTRITSYKFLEYLENPEIGRDNPETMLLRDRDVPEVPDLN